MKITRETGCYNERRYGKPWIASVDFTNGPKGEFTFGSWCGQIGEVGELYLDAAEGDIVARGQKDHRKPRNSAPNFYIVRAGGELEQVGKSEAYKHWQTRETLDEPNPLSEVSTDDLLAELSRRGVEVNA